MQDTSRDDTLAQTIEALKALNHTHPGQCAG